MYNSIKINTNINWALADQAMVSGVNFLTGILIARYIGLEEFGRFSLVWMVVLFCNGFQQAGIIAPMMSVGPTQNSTQESLYYGSVFANQIVWSLTCSIILAIGVLFSGYIMPSWQITKLVFPLSVTVICWQLQDFLRRYYFVIGQGQRAFFNDAVSYLGQLGLLVVLFQTMTLDAAKVLWVIAASSLIAILICRNALISLKFSMKMFVKVATIHWKISKWMLASVVMQWFSGNYYFIVAGSVLGPIAVGGIKAAQNIIGVTHILFQAMENFAPSSAARARVSGSIAGLYLYLKNLTVFGFLATSCIALIAWWNSEYLLNLLYGQEYRKYSEVLRWFCVIYIFSFLSLPLSVGLRVVEKTRPLFTSVFYIGIFSILLAYPLVILFGLNGAMIGLLFAKICSILFLFLAVRVEIKYEKS